MLSEKNIVRLILVLGFIHGLIFVFIVLPWEHYDEPAHFEYAWLIANRLRLPKPDDFDVNMRLDLGKSLAQSGFFARRTDSPPNLADPSRPIWAGVTQLSDPPFYYILDALPIFVLRGAPINTQLVGGRIFSLVFFLLTLWAAYQILCELTPPKSYLRWLVPLFLALLPGFAEFMSAVNNHVAAIGLISIWLLVAVRLIKRGLTLDYVAFLILLDITCYYTQKIAWITIPLTLLVLLLGLFKPFKVWIVWAMMGASVIGAILFSMQWNDAALWLRRSVQDLPTRTGTTQTAPLNNALQVKLYPDSNWGQDNSNGSAGFFQLLPAQEASALKGKVVTVGAWMWSDKPASVYGPGVNALYPLDDHWLGFPLVAVSSTPVFVSSTFQLPYDQQRIQIWLRATSPDNPDATLYISGVVMARGQWPTTPPLFTGSNGSKGTWGGRPFVNLARNSLMQASWPFPKPRVLKILMSRVSGLDPTHVSSAIALFLDLKGTTWYTNGTTATIFRSFWAKFCWDQVSLLPLEIFSNRPYLILLIISLWGGLGCLAAGYVWRKHIPWNEVAFLLVFSGGVTLVAYFYGVYIMGGGLRFRAFYPVARYVYPAVIPIASILVCGWSSWYTLGRRWLNIRPSLALAIFVFLMLGLDIYSYISILTYFRTF